MNQEKFDEIFSNLPPKRRRVLELLLQGFKNSEIDANLGKRKGNAGKLISLIYNKFDCARNQGNPYPRHDLIELFCTFRRDLVSRELFDQIRIDEYLCNTQSLEFFVKEGIKYFNRGEYQNAIYSFGKAIEYDCTDPVAQIFLNNAKAYSLSRLSSIPPLKIAVVISFANKFHSEASKDVLRGVAGIQTEFNDCNGKDGRLLAIVIADDCNQPELARKLAKDLSEDLGILGIIGHHSSEGTKATLEIYQESKIAIISPSSTSSELKSEVFFRTIGSTKKIAAKYASFIKESLGLDKIAVIYHQHNEYSQVLKDGFKESFEARGGQIIEFKSNINDPILDIEILIEIRMRSNAEAVLVLSSIETNSIALAIARENSKPNSQRLQLLFTTSLPEKLTLKRGGDSLEGAVFIQPDVVEDSDYMNQAKERWQQQAINWRVCTSYDAAQALIEAIKSSEKPTREEIRDKLETLDLSINQTSGFGLHWSDSDYHSNDRRQYCITQIRDNRFVKIY